MHAMPAPEGDVCLMVRSAATLRVSNHGAIGLGII
jgi:hypothetical protein